VAGKVWGASRGDTEVGIDAMSMSREDVAPLAMQRLVAMQNEASEDIPFELVGQVAGAGAVAEAGDIESSATARHDVYNRSEARLGATRR
jgi:hypothetical protein